MILTIVNVVYVLVAVGMIALILMQRGSGAAAGAGFGGGASATVFGARGASNFLSKSTSILAIVFLGLSLGMAVYASRGDKAVAPEQDLGVMGQLEQPAPADAAAVPALAPQPTGDVPAAPAPAPSATTPVDADAAPAATDQTSGDEG